MPVPATQPVHVVTPISSTRIGVTSSTAGAQRRVEWGEREMPGTEGTSVGGQEDQSAVFRGLAPGWYRDPANRERARYWDGTRLGEELRPISHRPESATVEPPAQAPSALPSNLPSAGWYLDEGRTRWWDGQQWGPYAPQEPAHSPVAAVQAHQVAAPRQTNGLAIASLVLGILWMGWLGSILAIILGYVALRQIDERNESGQGIAVAGVVLGLVGLAVGVIVAIFLLFASSSPTP